MSASGKTKGGYTITSNGTNEVHTYNAQPGAVIIIVKKWLPKEWADGLLTKIQEEVPMSQFYRNAYGGYIVPRRMFKFGNPEVATIGARGEVLNRKGYVYNPENAKEKGYPIYSWEAPYSVLQAGVPPSDNYEQPTDQRTYKKGRTWTNTEVGVVIRDIMNSINQSDQMDFNSVLLNEYEDGTKTISAHPDREALGRDNAVYGISLGDSRKFHFWGQKGTAAEGEKIELYVEHGDLMIMRGTTQEFYTHGINKQANVGYRVSLTFRHLGE